jgi:hypothetical protein
MTCVKESRLALQDLVQRGIVDIGIAPRPAKWAGPIVNLGWNEIVAILPKGDPLLERNAEIELAALADHPFVLYERGFGPSDSVLVACGDAGFQPHAVVTVPQVEAAARLAAAGLGVALVPEWNVPKRLRPLVRRLTSRMGADLTAFTRSEWSTSALLFLEVLTDLQLAPKPNEGHDRHLGRLTFRENVSQISRNRLIALRPHNLLISIFFNRRCRVARRIRPAAATRAVRFDVGPAGWPGVRRLSAR